MKLLILNASPKKRGGASRFFSGILRLFLPDLVKKKRFLCGAGKTLTMRFPSWAARTPYVSLSRSMWMAYPLI